MTLVLSITLPDFYDAKCGFIIVESTPNIITELVPVPATYPLPVISQVLYERSAMQCNAMAMAFGCRTPASSLIMPKIVQ